MKRTLILIAIFTLVALSASAASVVGSKHDLGSTTTAGAGFFATNTTQVCGFCHVPHNAYTGNATSGTVARLVPLWSHTSGTTAGYTMYSSPTGTLNGTVDANPTGVSLACMSCHDGTVGLGSLVVGDLAGVTPTNSASLLTGAALIGKDLSNDHPVSITYNTADTGLVAPAPAAYVYLNKVECASCHDVHDPAIPPFLRLTMAESALCTTCHIK